jgi:threonine/homoserine/homoserine lactone efflux protein
MLLAGLLGMAALLAASPVAITIIKVAGIAYLLWLAWKLFNAAGMGEQAVLPPMTLLQSCAFQLANPKAWVMVAATSAAYASTGTLAERIAGISLPFFVIGITSTTVWAWAGDAMAVWLKVGSRLRWFNRIMALSLAGTALWMGLQ